MKASLQERIAPPVQLGTKDLNVGTSPIEAPRAKDSNAAQKPDFRDLLGNSNVEAKRDREAKKNGDLSGAKTEAEFLEKLQKRNEPLRIPKNNLDKDDFLKLFVTQLQHQDPLNPDDSAEMASKLAHFNSLEQMLNVNKTLDKLVAAGNTGRQLQMVDYVGKEVTISGGRMRLKGGQPSDSVFEMPTASAETTLQVRDAGGVIVSEKKLGPMPMGEQKISWDGKGADGKSLPDGVYTYNLSAKSIDGQEIPVTINSRVKITGVDIQDSSGSVYTDFGKVKLSDIIAVGSPGYNAGAQRKEAAAPAGAAVGPQVPGGPTPQQLQQILEQQMGASAAKQAPAASESQAVSVPSTKIEATPERPVAESSALPRPDYSMQTDPTSVMMPNIATNKTNIQSAPSQTNENTNKPVDVNKPRSM